MKIHGATRRVLKMGDRLLHTDGSDFVLVTCVRGLLSSGYRDILELSIDQEQIHYFSSFNLYTSM